MSFIYMGNGDFGAITLKKLAARQDKRPIAVVTSPDKKMGRGQKLKPNKVKLTAIEYNIRVIETEDPNRDDTISSINTLNPDFILVCDFGHILNEYYCSKNCYNIHPSLLPKYRGANPIRASIFNGDTETGVTFIKITKEIDAGDIISSNSLYITTNETFGSLQERLADLSVSLFDEFIEKLRSGYKGRPQAHSNATHTKKLNPRLSRINWRKSAVYIDRRIRGLSPAPGAYCYYNDRKIKILLSRAETAETDDKKAGEIIDISDTIQVAAKNGIVHLEEIQPEGSKVMRAVDFVNGYRVKPGDHLT